LNCVRQSYENVLMAPGFAVAGGGTFVVGAPFSMRWQSLVKGYVPVPLIPFPVVLLQPGKVAVCDGDHFLTREPLRRRNGLEPHRIRRTSLVHRLDIVRTAASWLEIDRLDFCDPSELDAQPKAHENCRTRFAHRPHERDLANLGVREVVRVVSPPLHRLPEAIADGDHLCVLGVLHVLRQRHTRRVVRHERRQVLINDFLEARAIAAEGNGTGGCVNTGCEVTGQGGEAKGGKHGAHRILPVCLFTGTP
jgi:hypothetical protein